MKKKGKRSGRFYISFEMGSPSTPLPANIGNTTQGEEIEVAILAMLADAGIGGWDNSNAYVSSMNVTTPCFFYPFVILNTSVKIKVFLTITYGV